MNLVDILKLTKDTDRLKVVDEKSKELLYIGYVGMINATPDLAIKPDMEVTKLTYSHELWDKDWKAKNLREPIEKSAAVDQHYADLEERIYLYIRVKAN